MRINKAHWCTYALDPCHYFNTPGLSWDPVLKMTDIELNFISDIVMYQFIEKT